MSLYTVPDFPLFRDIIIEDKNLFDSYFNNIQPKACQLTFNNLFSWRRTEKTKISKIDTTLVLISKDKTNNYFLPLLNYEKKDLTDEYILILRWLKERQGEAEIKYIDDTLLLKIDKNKFNIIEDKSSYDYIYLTKDLIGLKGRKYDSKRNHIKYFEKNSSYIYEELNSDNIRESFRFEGEWCDMEKCSLSQKLLDEKTAINEMLDNFYKLKIKGGVIKIDGRIKALTIVERLNKDTFLVNIEKANPKIRGLYQAINQCFCKESMQEFKYVNREEDLGIEGLRKAKLSYSPVEMVRKYRISLI